MNTTIPLTPIYPMGLSTKISQEVHGTFLKYKFTLGQNGFKIHTQRLFRKPMKNVSYQETTHGFQKVFTYLLIAFIMDFPKYPQLGLTWSKTIQVSDNMNVSF